MGYTVMTCLSVVQVLGMPLMRWFELRDKKAAALRGDDSGTGSTGDGSGAGSTGDVSKTGSTESVGEVFVTDLKV